jgi:hypothetical protein
MTMKREIPDLLLEQYRIGEASEDAVRRIEADPDALARVDELNAESEAFFEAYPPELFVERIRRHADRQEGRQGRQERAARRSSPTAIESLRSWIDQLQRLVRQPAFVPAVALAVLGALLVPRMLTEEGFRPEESSNELATGERMKGLSSDLSIYRSDAEGEVEEIGDAATAAQGDRLQIAYRAAGARYGVILSVDGYGTVTLHYPDSAIGDATLIQDGEVALPYAYILDDAPYFEQFFFIAGTDEIDPAAVLSRVQVIVDAVVNGSVIATGEELADTLSEAIQSELGSGDQGFAFTELTLLKPAPDNTRGDEAHEG